MPNGRRESYEAVPRRPEQQGTEGPALSMSPVFSVPLLPCLNHTLSLSQPSVTPRTCSSVTLSPITSSLFTRLLVHLSTCHVTLSFSYPTPVSNIPCPISALCYSSNLFICYPVFLIPYPCLKHTQSLSQPSVTPRTCSSVILSFSYLVPLSSLPCPYPVTKKVKPYSFTFFFFPLLSLLMRSRAVTTKTYFVCPP
ncbi:hypothetical protein HMPREF0666_03294 [Prevotella sp. C561]|nr:hypothetical protein HMPREF0666_03294 [Prevotella sp. C561]